MSRGPFVTPDTELKLIGAGRFPAVDLGAVTADVGQAFD